MSNPNDLRTFIVRLETKGRLWVAKVKAEGFHVSDDGRGLVFKGPVTYDKAEGTVTSDQTEVAFFKMKHVVAVMEESAYLQPSTPPPPPAPVYLPTWDPHTPLRTPEEPHEK